MHILSELVLIFLLIFSYLGCSIPLKFAINRMMSQPTSIQFHSKAISETLILKYAVTPRDPDSLIACLRHGLRSMNASLSPSLSPFSAECSQYTPSMSRRSVNAIYFRSHLNISRIQDFQTYKSEI